MLLRDLPQQTLSHIPLENPRRVASHLVRGMTQRLACDPLDLAYQLGVNDEMGLSNGD